MRAPLLVLGWGNRSRGDDALAPRLLDALRAAGVEQGGAVELLEDFQLQPEHALDLAGRRALLFVDAALDGAAQQPALQALAPLPAAARGALFSHALAPAALLQLAAQLQDAVAPAWLLSLPGSGFALGAPLSAGGEAVLAQALPLALQWLERQGAALPDPVQP